MKKIIILLLAVVMCLTFVGCNLDSRKGKITGLSISTGRGVDVELDMYEVEKI